MNAPKTRDRGGRLRGAALVAVVCLPVGAAGSWWVATNTQMTAGVWVVLLVAGLTVTLLLLGPRVVQQ